MGSWPRKHDVFGTGISTTCLDELVRLLACPHPTRATVINVCNVHSVMAARRDPELAAAFLDGDANVPDGMPLVWVLRSHGVTHQTRVKGTELALTAMDYGASRGWRHFFYGTTDSTLQALRSRLTRRFPSLVIAGMLSPPFRAVSNEEDEELLRTVRDAHPHIVWVGLGMPKQEKWMHRVRAQLPGTVLVGIGAAFDFLAGTKPEAPAWLQEHGLEWAFRLASEPRRLWRRYAWNNPAFMALWLQSIARRQ